MYSEFSVVHTKHKFATKKYVFQRIFTVRQNENVIPQANIDILKLSFGFCVVSNNEEINREKKKTFLIMRISSFVVTHTTATAARCILCAGKNTTIIIICCLPSFRLCNIIFNSNFVHCMIRSPPCVYRVPIQR